VFFIKKVVFFRTFIEKLHFFLYNIHIESGDNMARRSPQDKENKLFFSAKFNELLSLHNKKQVDIHRDLNIPKSTITGYVKGSSLPTMGNLQKIADYFGVLKSDIDLRFKNKDDSTNDGLKLHLLSNFSKLEITRQQKVVNFSSDQLKQQTYEKNHTTKILPINETISDHDNEVYYTDDLLGAVSAGTGEWLDEVSPERVKLNTKPPKHDFSLRVNGNSMEPLFDDEQIIFVDKVDDPSQILSNQIVIAVLNGEAYVKKIVLEGGTCKLVSLNKDYTDILVKPSDEFYIRGVVVF